MDYPKIYQNNKVTNNNQTEFRSSNRSSDNKKIDDLFKVNEIYHKKVKLVTTNGELITTVIGATLNQLVTNEAIINKSDIKDIIEL